MIAAVVAVDSNYGIGSNNELLAHIPEDMKHFKEITTGGTVIVGRKTYDSLPKKPLPNRTNIIITSKANKPETLDDNTLTSNMEYIKAWLNDDKVISENNGIYVIGGGMIYKDLLPFCERVYITKVFHAYDNVDTYFPNIDNMPEWEITSASEIKENNGVQYQFCIYDRVDYEIYNISTHENDKDINENDMLITVKTFNSYKFVILRDNGLDFIIYVDDWEYLKTNGNVAKFIDRVTEYNNKNKEV